MTATIVRGEYNRGQQIDAGTHYAVITAAETNDLKQGPGKVGSVEIWGDDAGTTCTIDVYDNFGTSSGKVWRWASANGVGVFPIQINTATGIRIVTGGTLPTNGGVTVVFA